MSCYRDLRPSFAATLAAGLGPDSRIMSRKAGLLVPLSIYMRAQEIDLLAHISWQLCGDNSAAHPASLAEKYVIRDEPQKESFNDPEDFEAYRASIFAQGGETNS